MHRTSLLAYLFILFALSGPILRSQEAPETPIINPTPAQVVEPQDPSQRSMGGDPSQVPVPGEVQILSSQDKSFSILVPPSWVAAMAPHDQLEGYYISPGSEDLRPNFLVVRDDHRSASMPDLIKSSLEMVRRKYPAMTESAPTPVKVSHGKEGTKVSLSYIVENTNSVTHEVNKIQVMQSYYFFAGSKAYYVVICSYYPLPNAPDMGTLYDNLIRTVNVE